ncbi:MAG: hypothetical protein FWE13_02115 [Firmicutes bacterium]|nr:hypothetical protein [Bacillota bacterium]
MEQLEQILNEWKKKLTGFDLSIEALSNLYSVYPFNKFEYVISHLLATNTISLDDYLELRQNYIARNKFMHLYEITAPRTFGETWAHQHLNELVQELEVPSKKIDPNYQCEYDFYYDGLKIEVKASRAVKRKSGGSLVEKALSLDSKSGFDMNFQQIKPRCCDIFIWIGVWSDVIRYWLLTSNEVQSNKYFSKGQHRGNTGEGQLWIKDTNITEFDKYLVDPKSILERIKDLKNN